MGNIQKDGCKVRLEDRYGSESQYQQRNSVRKVREDAAPSVGNAPVMCQEIKCGVACGAVRQMTVSPFQVIDDNHCQVPCVGLCC